MREDFKKIYGEEPTDPLVVSLAIDSNDTHTSAEAFFGPIRGPPIRDHAHSITDG